MNKNDQFSYGAGISGLTSALELVEKGFDVTVYELDSTAVVYKIRNERNHPQNILGEDMDRFIIIT